MPRKSSNGNGNGKNGSFQLSYSTLGAIGAVVALLGSLWSVGSKVASKSDIDSLKAAITPQLDQHENRIRALEIDLARYFGPSQANSRPAPSASIQDQPQRTSLILAQYSVSQQAVQPPPRRAIIPIEMIREYSMEPSHGGAYTLLGDDGRSYSIDDIIAILIKIHFTEKGANRK